MLTKDLEVGKEYAYKPYKGSIPRKVVLLEKSISGNTYYTRKGNAIRISDLDRGDEKVCLPRHIVGTWGALEEQVNAQNRYYEERQQQLELLHLRGREIADILKRHGIDAGGEGTMYGGSKVKITVYGIKGADALLAFLQEKEDGK